MDELKTSYYFDDPAAFPFASVLCDLNLMQEYWKKKEDVVSAIKKDIRCPVLCFLLQWEGNKFIILSNL